VIGLWVTNDFILQTSNPPKEKENTFKVCHSRLCLRSEVWYYQATIVLHERQYLKRIIGAL